MYIYMSCLKQKCNKKGNNEIKIVNQDQEILEFYIHIQEPQGWGRGGFFNAYKTILTIKVSTGTFEAEDFSLCMVGPVIYKN